MTKVFRLPSPAGYFAGYNVIITENDNGVGRRGDEDVDEREQFYANKALREILENRLMGRRRELSWEGLRFMKRYVLFCLESGNEEDLERVLKACLILGDMKD